VVHANCLSGWSNEDALLIFVGDYLHHEIPSNNYINI
jgi:hypothetical protein